MITHEKTIRYAQTQIAEGELLSGKSILDSVLKQLQKKSEGAWSADIEAKREALLEIVQEIQDELRASRLRRLNSKAVEAQL